MSQGEWSERLTRAIADEVRRYRRDRGMSAQQLADECAKLGHPIARSVLANLENGRRPTVSVPELLVLAKALDVPPLALLLPFGHADTAELLPGRDVDLGEALEWLAGEQVFGGWDSLEAGAGWVDAAEVLEEFRTHRRDVQSLERFQAMTANLYGRADATDDEALAEKLRSEAARASNNGELLWIRIREFRAKIRRRGLTPPQLPPTLAAREEVEGPA